MLIYHFTLTFKASFSFYPLRRFLFYTHGTFFFFFTVVGSPLFGLLSFSFRILFIISIKLFLGVDISTPISYISKLSAEISISLFFCCRYNCISVVVVNQAPTPLHAVQSNTFTDLPPDTMLHVITYKCCCCQSSPNTIACRTE